MPDRPIPSPPSHPARIDLERYSADIQLTTLAIGIDNIHYDVFLSPRFVGLSRQYLLDLIRQTTHLDQFFVLDSKSSKPPEIGAFRRVLADLLQGSLTRAKFEKNIELDLLLRLAVLRFLTQEIGNQFSNLLLECKARIRARGEHFDRSEQAHVLKARLAELQADRRNVFRQVGQHLYQILVELEENTLSRSRRALFGEEFSDTYELLKNRLVFVEGGKDDLLDLEHYVLLGNFPRDQDRFEVFDALLLDFLRDFVLVDDRGEEMSEAWKTYDQLVEKALTTRAELARAEEERERLLRKLGRGEALLPRFWGGEDAAGLQASLRNVQKRSAYLQRKLDEMSPQLEAAKARAEFLTEQYHSRLGDYLNQPDNARRLFDPHWSGGDGAAGAPVRAKLLDEWVNRLEQRDVLVHVLTSYELRNVYLDYCPPVHLQQLRRALAFRDELKRVEDLLKQFPARRFSLKRVADLAKRLRHYPRDQARSVALRFAEDFMRLRRDRGNHQRLGAWMERINLIRSERTRELSRLNNSLYEFLLSDDSQPAEDRVVAHAVIKADVRGSTQITQDLLARGLNPASHFSLHLHEPVKRILERYGAARVFIEGDAIILAIYETESNRAHQRAVAKACVLAREILAVSQAYNARAESSALPRLELGLGVAFQNSPPTLWMDSDSRIMISRALNLSDRLSSCSKVARRVVAENSSPFHLFLFQTVMEEASEDESEEFLIRYNLNGIELNEEGFAKLSEEISLSALETDYPLPWGPERVTLYLGEVPIGEAIEPIVIRQGLVRQLLAGGKIGKLGTHAYYEVCTSTKVLDLVQTQLGAAARKG